MQFISINNLLKLVDFFPSIRFMADELLVSFAELTHASDTYGTHIWKSILQNSSDVCLPLLSERMLSVCFLVLCVIFLDFLTIHWKSRQALGPFVFQVLISSW